MYAIFYMIVSIMLAKLRRLLHNSYINFPKNKLSPTRVNIHPLDI